MNNLTNHPSAAQLRRFGLGRLDDEQMELVSEHVAYCDSCCQKLEQVHDDTLVELCKAAGAETAVEGLTVLDDASLKDAKGALEDAFRDHPRYRLRSPLGHGGMGLVYKAEHRLMDRMVAIKVIHPALTANANAIDRFQREIRAAGKLNHPNIVAALDAEQTGHYHCLIMEFAPGVSLDRIVKHRGVLHVAGACRIIQQAAQGLAHAHRRGMVHRDIKPQNLLATLEGHVKILDFGLARFASEQRAANDLTGDGMLGTPEYMSPEQIQRANEADIRSDIYSLGCTLYYLLAGHSPFFQKGQSAANLLIAHMQQSPPPLTNVRQDVPPRLEQFLNRMLAKDPSQRPQTPDEVAIAMEEIIRGAAAYATPDAGSVFVDDSAEDSGIVGPIELVTTTAPSPLATPAANLSEIAAELGDQRSQDPLTIDPSRQPARRLATRNRQQPTPAWVWLVGAAVIGVIAALLLIPPTLGPRGGGNGDVGTGANEGGGAEIGNNGNNGNNGGINGGAPSNVRRRVLLFVPDGYWPNDYGPLKGALSSQLQVDEVATSARVAPHALAEGNHPTLTIARRVHEVTAADYDGLIVIGGEGNQAAGAHTLFRAFRSDPNKFVAAICRGQLIVQQAGVLNNARVSEAGEFNVTGDESRIRRATGERWVVDEQNQLITATNEADVYDFATAIGRWLSEHPPSR